MITVNDPLQTSRWQAIAQAMSEKMDALGQPIDVGIMQTVIALNVLGFVTDQSCEGHDGWSVPWVHIVSVTAAAAQQQAEDAFMRGRINEDSPYHANNGVPAYQQSALEEGSSWLAKARVARGADLARLLDYLRQFYEDRSVDYACRLVVHPDASGFQLQSQGAEALFAQTVETQQTHLKEYQTEMQAFTAFLITCCALQPGQ